MAEEKRKTVKVICSAPNGIELRLFKPGHDDGTGQRPMTQDGPGVFVAGPSSFYAGATNPTPDAAPVETEVDEQFFAKWLEQNKLNPFVAEGIIKRADKKDADQATEK